MLGNVQFELQKLVDSYVSGLYIYIYICGVYCSNFLTLL
jgi:hypothetical protein